MKLPLKMLMEECIGNCRCSNESILESKWISEVRIYSSGQTLKKDILYVVTDDTMPDMPPAKQDITILLPFDLVTHLPEGYQWISVPEKKSFSRIISAIQDVFREFQDWYVKLCDACSFGCSLQEILQLKDHVTENCIYVADMSFKILAYTSEEIMTEISATWRYQMAHGYLPVHVMKGMIASGEFEKLNGYRMASHVYSRNFYIPFVTKNIYYNSKPQAHLFVINSMKRPCSRDIAVGQILGEFIEKHFFLLSEFNLNRIGSNHEAFFNDVLNGTCTDEIVIQRQLSLFDWSPSNDYCMAILDISSRDTGFQRTVMYELECATDLKCFVHESNLVVLQRNPDDKQKFFRRFLQNISRKYSLEICMGTVFSGFMKLKEQYQILTKVTGIVCRLGEHPLYYEAVDYGMYYVVDHILHTSELYHLCDKRALLLQQFDFQHGTDYFATFLSYLLHDRNMVHTSQALHIHRNTLMYRLEKIQNLIFFDEDDPDEMGSQIVSPDAWQPEQKIHMLLSMILLDYEKKG